MSEKVKTDKELLLWQKGLMTTHRGFSLVELLIAMAIATIIGLAGFSIFSSSNWSQKTQEDITEVQQNVRIAMDRLSKDIRMAGFGLPDSPSIKFTGLPTTFVGSSGGSITLTSPITVTTSGGTGNPDAITVLGIGYEVGKLVGQVAGTPVTGENLSNATDICVEDNEARFATQFSNRKYINIGGAVYKELTAASVTVCGTTGKKLTLATPLDRNYPDGTPVFIIQAVQYTIVADTSLTGCSATNPCLASNDATELRDAGRQVLAENIEDIQFAYGIDANPRDGKMDDTADGTAGYASTDFLNAPTDPTSIIAVRATMVGRTRNTDIKGQTGFKAQCFEDRAADAGTTNCTGAVSDGYRRRVLTKVLKIRNPRTGA